MKIDRLFVLSLLLSVSVCQSHAQTAASFIAQGRAFLAVSNIVSANQSFSNALVLSPTDPTGNVFYAATRLLVLPSQPTGGNFLTSLDIPAAGRNIYKWTARPSKDFEGIPLAPRGVSASSATSLLRNTVLAEVIGAEANLAMITATNFTLALTAQDTAMAAVTLDYGDIQLLRSMLDGMEYFIYNTYDWNLDAQLTIIRSLYSNGSFSLSGLLTDFPSLLTFATTNDLSSAKSAFVKAENTYITASQIVRNRPPGTVRLFNFDGGAAEKEANFRMVVSELASTLTNGPVTIGSSSNFSIFLPPTFTGAHSLRSFFPQIYNNGFVLGSLPDPTFGGVLGGVSGSMVEQTLAKHLTSIPTIVPQVSSAAQFSIRSAVGHTYVIQSSSNLVDWKTVSGFIANSDHFVYADPAGHNHSRQFYRVLDSHGNLPPPANDNFANRIPLVGLGVQSASYIDNATAEPNEPSGNVPSIWWSWTAQQSGLAVISFVGSQPYMYAQFFTGTALTNLAPVPDVQEPDGFFSAYNGYSFNAVAGTTYQIQAFSIFDYSGGAQIEIAAPLLTVTSPTDGATLSSDHFTISAFASDTGTPITGISYDVSYANPLVGFQTELQSGTVKGTSLNITFTNLIPTFYYITETATDALGISAIGYETITLQP